MSLGQQRDIALRCNGAPGSPVSYRVMGARSVQQGQIHFGTIRLGLCEERVRPSQGDDITSFWPDVTCRVCVAVAFQRLWDYAFSDLRLAAERLQMPVPKRRPLQPPIQSLPYSATAWEELLADAHSVEDDEVLGQAAHLRWVKQSAPDPNLVTAVIASFWKLVALEIKTESRDSALSYELLTLRLLKHAILVGVAVGFS